MNRNKLAIGLLAAVVATLPAPSPLHAAEATTVVDQSLWTSLKKEVRLPNGLRMAYVEAGDPAGKPLLLLHGYTDTSRSWSLLVPHLAKYRLLIPDQRGHGASEAPDCCYSTSQFAFDAKLFLDALGVERAGIAGHSLGSMVAIAFAAEYPDRVSKIALIGSTALVPVKRGDWLFDQTAVLKWPLDRHSEFMREWHPANQPTAVDRAFADAAMEEILVISPHVWRGVMRELAYVPVGRHASDVRAPALILSGGKDPLFPPEHHASLVKAFPGAESHVFPELGHNAPWEAPADVGERLARFFDAGAAQ
jgi:pimeloyl-ACP methyl ester carboxylesterase